MDLDAELRQLILEAKLHRPDVDDGRTRIGSSHITRDEARAVVIAGALATTAALGALIWWLVQ